MDNITQIQYLYLDGIFTNWDSHSEGSSILPQSTINRTYELWNHANDILTKNTTNNYLADAIGNLHKAINLRIKELNNNYHFNKSPFKTKDKKIYGQLEEFGIIRPKLINEITTFRNNIEHNDQEPPTHNRCLDYLEICWYFLKSTDIYVILISDNILFQSPTNDENFVIIDIDFENDWKINVRCRVLKEHISLTQKEGFFKLGVTRLLRGQEILLNPISEENIEVNFSGHIIKNNVDIKPLISTYFKSVF